MLNLSEAAFGCFELDLIWILQFDEYEILFFCNDFSRIGPMEQKFNVI